jgi:hypothetical protein
MTSTQSKVQKLLTKHKVLFTSAQKHKLTLYHNSAPFIYGLPKIHKPGVPLHPMVNCTGTPCVALAGLLHIILSSLVDDTGLGIKDTVHFKELNSDVTLGGSDMLVSLDIVNLFNNVRSVPDDEGSCLQSVICMQSEKY